MKNNKNEDKDVTYASIVISVFLGFLWYFSFNEDSMGTLNTIVAFVIYVYISYRCEKAEMKVKKVRERYSKALNDMLQKSMEKEGRLSESQ